MIDAGDFGHPKLGTDEKSFYRFGITTNEEAAKAIRRFADQVEQGKVIIQKVQSGTIANVTDYTQRAIMIEYVLREGKVEL